MCAIMNIFWESTKITKMVKNDQKITLSIIIIIRNILLIILSFSKLQILKELIHKKKQNIYIKFMHLIILLKAEIWEIKVPC